MPKYFVDQSRPGIVRWDDDPMTGAMVGLKAAEFVHKLNAHDAMLAAIDAAINWYTPPNDSKTAFPLKQLADAAAAAHR